MVLTVVGSLAVGVLGLGGLIYGGSYVLSSMSDCSGKERAILKQYPHYGNRQIATYPWTFSCSVRYTTKATRKEVLGYYDDVLAQNGWEVLGFQAYLPNQGLREGPARGERLSDLWGLPRSAEALRTAPISTYRSAHKPMSKSRVAGRVQITQPNARRAPAAARCKLPGRTLEHPRKGSA
jgi:hypothetical protein